MEKREYFVKETSIVRDIWGTSDTVLFIFAGAAAEFALSKAVDWLYFTGKLPADPLGRLFSTVGYARTIIFSNKETAHKSIDVINAIHKGVESKRGMKIPDWAFRDVLFMLIDYSIRSYELLERKLTDAEKEEVFDVFNRLGKRMKIAGLPENFEQWQLMREVHLHQNLENGRYTKDLFRQYRRHLGPMRYRLMILVQRQILPVYVLKILTGRATKFCGATAKFCESILIHIYKKIRKTSHQPTRNNHRFFKIKGFSLPPDFAILLLPGRYKKQLWEPDNSR